MLTSGEVAAVCYGDIFDFPLTSEELTKFSIKSFKTKVTSFPKIQNKNGYFFMKGRDKLIGLRKKRTKYSIAKLAVAEKVTGIIRLIPTVQMVAVTGALAMQNCDKYDDIDLLIVARREAIWTTRFFAVLLLELLGKRRRPKDTNSSNKICLNMFLDEDHLQVPKKEQDIFAAHEVAQVKILWSRGGMDRKFWEENGWIRQFLPKYQYSIINNQIDSNSQTSNSKQKHFRFESLFLKFILNLNIGFWSFGEKVLRSVQLFYMNSHRTNEVIKDGYLRFHPKDARRWIIPEYEKRLAIVGLK